MKKSNCLLTLVLASSLLLVFPGAVAAREGADDSVAESTEVEATAKPSFKEAHPELKEAIKNAKTVRKEVRTEVKEKREQTKEERCEMINSRLQNRLKNYDETKEKYNNRYQGVVKMLQDLVSKVKGRGCDTTTLESNLKTFQGLIEEFAAAFRVFVDSLKGSQQYACGESEGKFAGALKSSQGELQTVKVKAEALRAYYQNTLKPSVKALKTTCRELKPTASPVSAGEGE